MNHPIIILVGEERLLLSRELAKIKKEVLPSGPSPFNCDVFSAKSDSVEKIMDVCLLFPMMSPKRLVIVDDAEVLKKEDFEKWEKYFEKPSPTTQLVFIASKIDLRLKLWKKAHASGFVHILKAPYQNELPGWIMKEAFAMGLTLPPEAARELADRLGINLGSGTLASLLSVLETLQLFVAPKTAAKLADLEEVLGGASNQTVFDLADCVGSGKFSEASLLTDQVVLKGEPYVRLLFMIARHFRILLSAREGEEAGESSGETARFLKIPPFFMGRYLSQAQRLSRNSLYGIFRSLLKADRALKGSPLPPSFVLRRFLTEVCFSTPFSSVR